MGEPSSSDQTIFCLMDQAGLPNQRCMGQGYCCGSGTDIHYLSDQLVLQGDRNTYTFGSNANCHFDHWPFSIDGLSVEVLNNCKGESKSTLRFKGGDFTLFSAKFFLFQQLDSFDNILCICNPL